MALGLANRGEQQEDGSLGSPYLGCFSSQNPNKQTHKNVTDERSDSSEYLPRVDEG
jgi:hypothetical protein